MNKIELFDKDHYVFLSRIQFWKNPQAQERLKTVRENIIWDDKTQGAWIKRGSTAHSLATLLGLEAYDIKIRERDGTYDKNGLIR